MNLMEKYLERMTNTEKPVTKVTEVFATTETIFCDFIKIDVDRKECYKPKGCFHRDEDDRPIECMHLKTFVRQRNAELGIQI